ncbi:MAG: D-alanyl-D-alanine carboxypeptidase/D-alanyl-D-alanine-endopeptidase [Bryobacterales bacterium]|nr:D-alanyl-D-alanine carboxypeptidase/D-alanyl-D-alanine-endopeptidase [Bryobacterales bacterium]
MTPYVLILMGCFSLAAKEAATVRKPAVRMTTAKRIQTLLDTPAGKNARWGIHVVNLKSGRVLYELHANEQFTPASNTKLFSTALALERLGPGHRFTTTIRAAKAPDANGVIHGDLRMVGGGDPTLSGRAYPYQKDADRVSPLEPVEQLAEQLIQRGVREVRGDIVGDDRLYVWAPYPEGWTVDDSLWDYGAPVSALPFNDNTFTLALRPAPDAGALSVLSLNPPFLPFTVDNRVTTSANGTKVQLDRAPGSRNVRLYGSVALSSRGVRQTLAVDDPALYAAYVLRDVLTRRGIRVEGHPVALHRWTRDEPFDPLSGVELARRSSQPLTEVARVVNKVSQNLHAEILLREVARVKRKEPTREAGLKELEAFLTEIDAAPKSFHFEDGSGLSRRTLIAPATLTRLLAHMDARPYSADWDSLLPVAGEDGTLALRFEKAKAASAIHAKTGTLATASALSGYVTTKRGARLAFSIIANNHTLPSSEIRKVVDRIALALVED